MTSIPITTVATARVPGGGVGRRTLCPAPARALAVAALLAGLLALLAGVAPGTAVAAGPRATPATGQRGSDAYSGQGSRAGVV